MIMMFLIIIDIERHEVHIAFGLTLMILIFHIHEVFPTPEALTHTRITWTLSSMAQPGITHGSHSVHGVPDIHHGEMHNICDRIHIYIMRWLQRDRQRLTCGKRSGSFSILPKFLQSGLHPSSYTTKVISLTPFDNSSFYLYERHYDYYIYPLKPIASTCSMAYTSNITYIWAICSPTWPL